MARVLLSPLNTAEVFSVHPETLRRLYRSGRIPGYKVGRFLRFDPDEVREALRTGGLDATSIDATPSPDFDALDAA